MVIGSYFHEHGEEVRKMLIRKSFSDGVKAEEKATVCTGNMQVYGKNISQIVEKLGIRTYIYYNDFGELDKAQSELVENCTENFDEKVVRESITKENLDAIDNGAHGFYQDSDSSLRDYRRMYDLYIHKQDNALLYALNQKALLTIHVRDFNNLSSELQQIKSRTVMDRIIDTVTGQSRRKKDRAMEIENALGIITERINKDKEEVENPSMPTEEVTPEQVMANLYKARLILETKRGNNQQYAEMINYIFVKN